MVFRRRIYSLNPNFCQSSLACFNQKSKLTYKGAYQNWGVKDWVCGVGAQGRKGYNISVDYLGSPGPDWDLGLE
jgi:hypothetical protein